MPITPYTGTWGQVQRRHLLRRTLFGVNKSDLAAFANSTMTEMVTALLTIPVAPPTPPLVDYVARPISPTQPSKDELGMTWIHNGQEHDRNNEGRLQSLEAWWAGLIVKQDRNIREKMTLFWHNHVPTDIFTTVLQSMYCYSYNALLRKYCLGNFKTLMREMTVEPAMLIYLNGAENEKTAPNENYARELQELFCIGKDISPSFTEGDVQAAAQILTGWVAEEATLQTKFNPNRHTTTDKVFSSFYNYAVVSGRSDENAGAMELDALLNIIFSHPEVARFVVRKIYRYFVYYAIDATIETEVIEPLAHIFRSSGYEIKPVLHALFTSQHFYDLAATNSCLIKSPTEHNIGFARVFGLNLPSGLTNLYASYRHLIYEGEKQGQRLGNPPDVAGWPAYYQTPNFHQLWITADALRQKKEFCDRYLTIGLNGMLVDVLAFTKTLEHPEDPDLLVEEALSLLHTLPSDGAIKYALKEILLDNQSNNYYWMFAWNNYINAPTNEEYASVVTKRLQFLYQTIVNMAEFHLS
jgi:uncharacterized protein (DUF1800 family)